MRSIYFVALNTFKELARDKTFYILFAFGIIMLGFSMVLAQLTATEQHRLTVDFGLTGIHIAVVALSIFAGSTLVFRELEKKTVLFLLSKPINREQFLIGKFVGLLVINLLTILGLALMLIILFHVIGWQMNSIFYISLVGIILEAMVLLSITLFLGVLVRPTLVVTISVCLFLIGHWMNGFKALMADSESVAMRKLSEILPSFLPNLENFNWRNQVVENIPVSFADLGNSALYCLFWCLILFSMSYFAFRRKDFV